MEQAIKSRDWLSLFPLHASQLSIFAHCRSSAFRLRLAKILQLVLRSSNLFSVRPSGVYIDSVPEIE